MNVYVLVYKSVSVCKTNKKFYVKMQVCACVCVLVHLVRAVLHICLWLYTKKETPYDNDRKGKFL